MIKIRSLLKEDDFDLSDNPLRSLQFLRPGQCLEISMEMSRGFYPDQINLIDKDADVFVKESLDEEVAERLDDMYEEISSLVEEGEEFDPEDFSYMGDHLDVAEINDKVYFFSTGEESGKFIIGYNLEFIDDLENYINVSKDGYEIKDDDGLEEYLQGLREWGGDDLDTGYNEEFFINKAIEYHKKIEQ